MKRFISGLILVVLAISALTACGGGGKSPTDVAKDFMNAWEKGDKNKMKDIACTKPTDDELDQMTGIDVKFSDLKYKEQDKKDNSATVVVSGTMESEGQSVPLTLPIPMKKKSGDWCVDTTNNG